MRFSVSSTFLPLSIVSLVAGQSFDCKTILADGQAFDISPLEGPHSVVHLHRTPTALKNTTFTIDLCKPLDRAKSTDKNKECPSSTRGMKSALFISAETYSNSLRLRAILPQQYGG